MNERQFKRFMKVQRHKIDVDKWCEGERIDCDPGQKFIMDWIATFAVKFRELFSKSLCKDCVFWNKCGYKVLRKCRDYHHT